MTARLDDLDNPDYPAYTTGRAAEALGVRQAFLRALEGLRVIGCDVVEVAPPYDPPGTPTALLGATIAWELIALRALVRHGVAR